MYRSTVGPQARKLPKCSIRSIMRKTPGQRGFLTPATRGSIKVSDKAITPIVEVHVLNTPSATRVPASPAAVLPSRLTVTSELPQAKKLRPMHLGVATSFEGPSLLLLWTMACQAFKQGGGFLLARILEHIDKYWLPYPPAALNFLLS